MLSLNFNQVRRSGLLKLDNAVLLYVFIIFFVDFYDTSLYIGYIIYLRKIIFPQLDIFGATVRFAMLFATVQIFKVFGFAICSYIMPYHRKLVYVPLITFFLSSMGLAAFWIFGAYSNHLIPIFLVLRFFQALSIGAEICFAVQITNSVAKTERTKISMYYFILLAGECGIFISIAVNRYLLSHGVTILQFMHDWRIQLMFSGFLALVAIYLKAKNLQKYRYNNFSQKVFFLTILRHWKLILIRSGIGFYSFLLIVIIIIRIPYILEYDYGWTHATINKILLLVTVFGFLGANLASILARYVEHFSLMVLLYIASMITNCYFYYIRAFEHENLYAIWVVVTGFSYGAFLRLTPEVLNSVSDFNFRNRLVGRYMSYFFVYTICSAAIILCLDYMHYVHHLSKHNNKLAETPLLFILFCGMIGLSAILIYRPYYRKNYNREWIF